MRPRLIALIAALIVLTALLAYTQLMARQTPTYFVAGGERFNFTYVATTQQEQMQGLMNKTIYPNTTMLFIFDPPGDYPFWMYNTESPLDIIWLLNGKVVYVQYNASTCGSYSQCANETYDPYNIANMVIETKAGFATRHDIVVGSEIAVH